MEVVDDDVVMSEPVVLSRKVWVAESVFHTTPLCAALDGGQRSSVLTHIPAIREKIPGLRRCPVCSSAGADRTVGE